MLSRGRLFATPRTVALQVPLSVGFSRREDWGGLPFPPPGDRPHPGTEPTCPTLRADCLFNIFLPLSHCITALSTAPFLLPKHTALYFLQEIQGKRGHVTSGALLVREGCVQLVVSTVRLCVSSGQFLRIH